VLFCAALGLVLVPPAVLALVFGMPASSTYGLAAATFVIEYGAAAAGIALGMHPVAVFLAVNAVSLGIVLACYACLDALADRSPRLQSFAGRMAETCSRSRGASTYGPLVLVPGMLAFDFYVCAPAAWCIGWTRPRAIAAMVAGEIIGTFGSLAAVMGLLTLAS
jgi:hypothetical protein